MKLIEIVVMGVPGVQGALRFPLQPGFNPWQEKGSFRLESLLEIIATLLYPSLGQESPLGPGRAQRAGMTFEARGTVYRITRDYVSKRLGLAQLEPGTRDQFREISHEQRFITATLARSARVPSRRMFRTLLIARPGLGEIFRKDDPASSVSVDVDERTERNSGDRKARLRELKRERDRIQRIQELEFRQDEVQSRLFKIEEQLRRLDEPRGRFQEVLEDYESYRVFDEPGLITPQLRDRLKKYAERIESKDQGLVTLDENAEQWTADLSCIPERPVWREPFAMIGASVALVAFVAATFVRLWPWLFWLCLLLVVAGLATAGWGVLLGFRRIERLQSLRQKIRNLDTEKAGIEKRFHIETTAVRRLMEIAKSNDSEEIADMLARRDNLQSELQRVERELKQVEEEVPEADLQKEQTTLKTELESIENELQNMPAVSMDPNSLERKIRDLEVALRSDPSSSNEERLPAHDDLNQLLALAADALHRPLSEVLSQAQKGMAMNVATITRNRYVGVRVAQGRIAGFRNREGGAVQWGELDREMQARLLFAVQFTFWQLIASEDSMPFVLDLLSGNVSKPISDLCLSAARHVAKRTQVLALAR